MSASLPRVMPALITPFADDETIDTTGHRANVAFLIARGVDGLVIAGSTGEGPVLEPGEREALVAQARDVGGGGLSLVCGIAAESVRLGQRQVEEAARGNADAVLVMPPATLVRGRPHLTQAYLDSIADESPLPVLLYSVPGVVGYELSIDTIRGLLEHPNVIGLKDSGGNPERIGELSDAIDGGLLYAGSSAAVAASMAAGAFGAITASANYAYSLVAELVAAPETDEAERLQSRLATLTSVVEAGGIAATKVAAHMVGLVAGRPRRPLQSAPDRQRAEIAAALATAALS